MSSKIEIEKDSPHASSTAASEKRDAEDFRTGWLKHLLWMKGILERGDSWFPPSTGGLDL